ncbi:thioesterase family protein [Rutstroemia sp. NJR-2017a WRK4]|nr:thioesterase family protein [Rutstroemia sp. NJR-2017a WRK4]
MKPRIPIRISQISRSVLHPVPGTSLRCHRTAQLNTPRIYASLFNHTRPYSTQPPSPNINNEPTPIPTNTPQHRDLRSQFAPQPPPQSQQPIPKQKRSLRPAIYASLFLLIGLTAGQYISLIVSPPPLPEPNTATDDLMTTFIYDQASKIPLVQSLTSDPNWESWDAYSVFTPNERPHRLTTGPLGGSRGLGGYQRIFYNPSTGEFISVVYFGGALAGWPGVTHGGLIATILDESLGRCAIRQLGASTGVTATLELKYLKPSVTNAFYVVRCVPILEGASERKRWVEGRLETLEGRVCVEGKGLFVVPKGYQTREITGGF